MYGRSASTRAATSRMPRPRASVEDVCRTAAAATGSVKIVPRLARIAFGLKRSVRGSAAITASRAGAVGGPQDRAEVAGLLDALDDDDERLVGQASRPSSAGRRRPDDRDDAVRPVAERELARGRRLGHRASGRSSPRAGRRPSRASSVRTSVVADERRLDLDAGVECPEQLAGAVDDRQAGRLALAPVAQPDRGLDPRVRQARDRAAGSVIGR